MLDAFHVPRTCFDGLVTAVQVVLRKVLRWYEIWATSLPEGRGHGQLLVVIAPVMCVRTIVHDRFVVISTRIVLVPVEPLAECCARGIDVRNGVKIVDKLEVKRGGEGTIGADFVHSELPMGCYPRLGFAISLESSAVEAHVVITIRTLVFVP